MIKLSPATRYGLLTILLAAAVLVVWGLLLPRLHDRQTRQTIQDITSQPVEQQTAPTVPVHDAPAPPHTN